MLLVTGANGFVGSHLSDHLLALGEPVAAGVRASSDLTWLTGKAVALRRIDLATGEGLAQALADARVVFHVAGVTRSATAEAFRKGNCEATVALAEAALKFAPRLERFVFVSSLAAAGPARPGVPLDETVPRRPVSSYGESKRDAEAALEKMAGLPLTVVRPPIVYGPRDINLLALFRTASRRLLPVVGAGRQRLSFVHAGDLAAGIARAGLSGNGLGRTYFLTGGNQDWRQAQTALEGALGRKLWRLSIPPPVLRVAGEAAECWARLSGTQIPFNRRKVKEMLEPEWSCSSDLAKTEIGFSPRFDLERGFADTWAWYRDHGWA